MRRECPHITLALLKDFDEILYWRFILKVVEETEFLFVSVNYTPYFITWKFKFNVTNFLKNGSAFEK